MSPVLVGEQLEEPPDLFRQAGVALQQGEGGEEHLVRDAQEAAQQRLLGSHAQEVTNRKSDFCRIS